MNLTEAASDVKLWIISAVVLAFIVGDLGDAVPKMMIIVLMLQITASMIGIRFGLSLIRSQMRSILMCVFFCFVLNTGLTIICAYLFPSEDAGVFYGWIMVAAVPCAVSCITVAFTMYGNRVLSVVSLVVIYFLALAVTPLITTVFIGDAVPSFEILKYIVLFVAVPLILTVPLNRLSIPRSSKTIFINIMMFLLVFLSVGRCRDYILSSLDIIGWIIVFAAIRVFVVGALLFRILRHFGADRGNSVDYVSMAVWKNTGLAMSLCLLLIPEYPQAAVPCAVCLMMESLWYAVYNSSLERLWPRNVETVS